MSIATPCRPRAMAQPARRAAVLLLLLAALAPSRTLAADATCALPSGAGELAVRVGQSSGRAVVQVERAGSGGRTLEVDYNDDTFFHRFDDAGRAEVAFALLAPRNEITVRMSELPAFTCRIDVPDFDQFYRVALLWRDPVRMALHVVEPGQKLGTFGHVSPDRPNTDLTQGIGRIDIATDAPQNGSTGEVSYVIANPRAIPPGRFFNFRLEYVSRGKMPSPPYCGEHPLAAVDVQLVVIDGGRVSQRSYGTARAQCGQALTDAAQLQPLR